MPPVLWNPPIDAEFPPFYALCLVCTAALEAELGLTPRDMRAVFTAEGMCAERPFLPTHVDPNWKEWAREATIGIGVSASVYERGLIIHTKYLRNPRFIEWFVDILERMATHKDALRGVAEGRPDPVC